MGPTRPSPLLISWRPLVVVDDVRGRRPGVDIELRDRRLPDTRALARSVLSPAELDALDRSPRGERDALFLRAWTRKEAVLKAMGVGLSMPTTGFDVLRLTGSAVEDVSPVNVDGRRYVCQSVDSEPEVLLAVARTPETSLRDPS